MPAENVGQFDVDDAQVNLSRIIERVELPVEIDPATSPAGSAERGREDFESTARYPAPRPGGRDRGGRRPAAITWSDEGRCRACPHR